MAMMWKCKICGRGNITEKEIEMHLRFFHGHEKQGAQKLVAGACPDCGYTLWFEEGCATCHSCGYSKCQ